MLTHRRSDGDPLRHSGETREGRTPDVLSPGRMNRGLHESTVSVEAELEQLRAQVAWLKAEREKLRWEVTHDELTGLPNRRLFSTLAPAELRPGITAALILLDLNGFKPINDQFGHEAGDHVLRMIALRLVSCIPDGLVARLGGDEFVGVLVSPDAGGSSAWWHQAVVRLSGVIAQPMQLAGHTLRVTASIGVAPADEAIPVTELLRRADLAMYQAKIRGSQYASWRLGDVDAATTAHPAPRVDMAAHNPQVLEPWPTPSAHRSAESVHAPTCDPDRREPREVAPASSYHPADPVWVYRYGAWRPGIVDSASSRAVMVTYRLTVGSGTVVDTLAAECVLARATADAHLDPVSGRHETAA